MKNWGISTGLLATVALTAVTLGYAQSGDTDAPRVEAVRPGPPPGPPEPEEIFQQIDADNDGAISLKEFVAAHERRMREAPQGQNGRQPGPPPQFGGHGQFGPPLGHQGEPVHDHHAMHGPGHDGGAGHQGRPGEQLGPPHHGFGPPPPPPHFGGMQQDHRRPTTPGQAGPPHSQRPEGRDMRRPPSEDHGVETAPLDDESVDANESET